MKKKKNNTRNVDLRWTLRERTLKPAKIRESRATARI